MGEKSHGVRVVAQGRGRGVAAAEGTGGVQVGACGKGGGGTSGSVSPWMIVGDGVDGAWLGDTPVASPIINVG